MRLLHYNSDGNFSLTEFFDKAIPDYAILSHRWGTEEATFEDLQKGMGTNKAGYEKLRFCGEQARDDGLKHFWVDTYCIDKSSSTELAEALNSMYRWYRDAARCYVYLLDVSALKRKAGDTSTEYTWDSAFRDSEWFTRGWTLQELLAPRSVEFFSQQGKRLGDKEMLGRQIQEVTGIPISVLEGAPLSQFSIEERLSWAENRKTTRPEDKAYSLLGIFGIHLLPIYGEGKEHAFRRLKKKIQKSLTGEYTINRFIFKYLLIAFARRRAESTRPSEPKLYTRPADNRSPRGQEADRRHEGRAAARLLPMDSQTSRFSTMARR